MSDADWRPVATLDIARLRARVLQDTRAFFIARGVLEVETPVLSSASASDRHLRSLQSKVVGTQAFLNTSPEFAMKRLLAAWGEPVFQVCKVFRDEEIGPNHNPEFTMLEWYRPGFDMFALMDEVQALVTSLSGNALPKFGRRSYRELFESVAGFNPHAVTAEQCRCYAIEHNIDCPAGLDDVVDEWLDWLLTQSILPSLPLDAYTFIYDYPASQCALAKLAVDESGNRVAQRFELLYGELELANGYFELQDADEQRERFAADNEARRVVGAAPAVIDARLLSALEYGLPECAGVALGMDRLLMAIAGLTRIDDVLLFPWGDA